MKMNLNYGWICPDGRLIECNNPIIAIYNNPELRNLIPDFQEGDDYIEFMLDEEGKHKPYWVDCEIGLVGEYWISCLLMAGYAVVSYNEKSETFHIKLSSLTNKSIQKTINELCEDYECKIHKTIYDESLLSIRDRWIA